MLKRHKRKLSTWILLLASLGLIVLGVRYLVKINGDEIRADELKLMVTSNQQEFYENEEFQFDVTISEPLNKNELYLEVPKEFELDTEEIIQENQTVLKKIEPVEAKQKITLEQTEQYPVKLAIKGKLTIAGDFKVRVSDEIGEEKQFPITVTVRSSSESQDEVETDEQPESELEGSTNPEDQPGDQTDHVVENDLSGVDNFSFSKPPLDFDWEILNNDGLDLSTFTKVNVNTPVKLSDGLFDKQERNYFMFLGHVGQTSYNYKTEKFTSTGDMYRNMSSSQSKGHPILSPAILGVKKQVGSETTGRVVDHTYNDSRATQFDIGEMSEPSGKVNLSGGNIGDNWMVSQYSKKNELVAYGFLYRKNPNRKETVADYQPVRIHGHVVDYKSGRIRYDVTYYNPQSTEKAYGLTYGIHIDIGGAHGDSKLFSNGTDGLYFDEEKVPADGLGENLYFHMEGYGGNSGPTAYKVGNYNNFDPLAYWNTIGLRNQLWLNSVTGYEDPYQNWDALETVGYQYPLIHPIFAYRWDPIKVPAGGVGTGSFDISLEEKANVMPKAEKTYENLTSKDKKNHLNDTLKFTLTASNSNSAKDVWENVSIKDVLPKELDVDTSSFKLINFDGNEVPVPASIYQSDTRTLKFGAIPISPGQSIKLTFKAKIIGGTGETIVNTMEAGNNEEEETREAEVSIPVEPKEISFKVLQEVFHTDGTEAATAKKGEMLTYKTTLKNPFTEEDGKQSYDVLQLTTDLLDSNLEDFSDLTFKDAQGNSVGMVFHVPSNNRIYASFDKVNGSSINASQDFFLEYKATVKESVEKETIIYAKSAATAILSNNNKLPYTTSNRVETIIQEGSLLFVSAPTNLNFGNDLKISAKDKSYPIQNKDEELIVQDSRGKGNQWSMRATLLKELTGESGHQLMNSLHYYNQGKELAFTIGDSIPIRDQKTTDNQPVEISNDWQGIQKGPVLKVKAGQPYSEKYTGAIQWTLQSVPGNE